MSAKKRIIYGLGAACLLLASGLVRAEQRYIVDTITVSLRQGPGSQFKVLKTLQTGQAFEVLESKNGYSRVQMTDGTEGWVQEQFTSSRPPSENAMLIKELNDKVKELKAQNDELLKAGGAKVGPDGGVVAEGGEVEMIKKLRDRLAEATRRYELLENESKDVLAIKADKEALESKLADMQKGMTRIQSENVALGNSQSILWFLAGGGVFFAGWMLGKLSGRKQRQSLLSF